MFGDLEVKLVSGGEMMTSPVVEGMGFCLDKVEGFLGRIRIIISLCRSLAATPVEEGVSSVKAPAIRAEY